MFEKTPTLLRIEMPLYESDAELLLKFIRKQQKEEDINSGYWMLHDFAIDLRNAKTIQVDLLEFLFKYYLIFIERAIVEKDNIALPVYQQLNAALFVNGNAIKDAIGNEKFDYIINRYTELLLIKMEVGGGYDLSWISLFNTISSFDQYSNALLPERIMNGNDSVRAAFFVFLSVLLFIKKDNPFVGRCERLYDTESLLKFDVVGISGCYWKESVTDTFRNTVNESYVRKLLNTLEQYFTLEKMDMLLMRVSVEDNFRSGIWETRVEEYLKKIGGFKAK